MDDIEAVEMDASAITTAMVSGKVDACATWSPNTLTIYNELGDKAVELGANKKTSQIQMYLYPASLQCLIK